MSSTVRRVRRFLGGLSLACLCPSLLSGCINLPLLAGPGPLRESQIGGERCSEFLGVELSCPPKIVMMDLSGVISAQESRGLLDESPSLLARIKEELTLAGDDPTVQALVLRINSPGGTVAASDVLYHEIRRFKEKKKIPVIASIMEVGASGGYYVAMAADQVVAHPSSVTGSLGVIMLTLNAQGLLEKIGVESTAITSGPRKDMGSPFRRLTDEERAIFQKVIDGFYERFLGVIKEGRPRLSAEDIRKLADGRIYSGDQAKTLGLVDGVGYLEDAVSLAKQQAGVNQARLVRYRRPGEYRPNIYALSSAVAGAGWSPWAGFDLFSLVRAGTPQFMYLWMP